MPSPPPIPAFDYRRQLASYRDELDAAMARVLDSGCLILGPEVRSFEAEFAASLGVEHAVGVASGTDALILALRALGIQAGDRVITVANTAVPTVSAIRAAGGLPLLVDIEPDTLQMSASHLAATLERPEARLARCVLPVHLHGQAADMTAIQALAAEHQLPVVADCAQAYGTQYHGQSMAQWADISCFSFYPTKNLAACGDGGMCVTGSGLWAARLRELRQYGFGPERIAVSEGVCSRLDELQAAILRVRLRHFARSQQARQEIADRYRQGLAASPLSLPEPPAGTQHAWHQFVIRWPRRAELCAALEAADIGYGIHYPLPIHLMPAYGFLDLPRGSLPHTELAAEQILSLPMFPGLRSDEVDRIIATVQTAVGPANGSAVPPGPR